MNVERFRGWFYVAAVYNLVWGTTFVLAPGPIGFVWAAASGDLPWRFGLTIVTNDLIWLPAFALYLRAATRERGLRSFLLGERP